MDLPCYLAMTAEEYSAVQEIPDKIAWMACHFSCYGTGISNIPFHLPPNSLLILNDRIPPMGHNATQIAEILNNLAEQMKVSGILLDFQQPYNQETAQLTKQLVSLLQTPAAVSEQYAHCSNGPVLVSVPAHRTVKQVLNEISGRDIWLELVTDSELATITENGCEFSALQNFTIPKVARKNDLLNCHYHTEVHTDRVLIRLWRQKEDLEGLLKEAYSLGIQKAIGLYQQFSPTQ